MRERGFALLRNRRKRAGHSIDPSRAAGRRDRGRGDHPVCTPDHRPPRPSLHAFPSRHRPAQRRLMALSLCGKHSPCSHSVAARRPVRCQAAKAPLPPLPEGYTYTPSGRRVKAPQTPVDRFLFDFCTCLLLRQLLAHARSQTTARGTASCPSRLSSTRSSRHGRRSASVEACATGARSTAS